MIKMSFLDFFKNKSVYWWLSTIATLCIFALSLTIFLIGPPSSSGHLIIEGQDTNTSGYIAIYGENFTPNVKFNLTVALVLAGGSTPKIFGANALPGQDGSFGWIISRPTLISKIQNDFGADLPFPYNILVYQTGNPSVSNSFILNDTYTNQTNNIIGS